MLNIGNKYQCILYCINGFRLLTHWLPRLRVATIEEAMLQLQLLVPLMKADASVMANLKRGETMELELTSDIKLPMTTSLQKIALKYGRI